MSVDLTIQSFNAGVWSPHLDGRSDMEKYYSACRILENMIPLPYGDAERRPGTYFVTELKDSSKKAALVSFQYSSEQAYVLEMGDEYIRFIKDRGQITTGVGTEDLSSLDNIVAHYLLNDDLGTQVVLDDDGNTHDALTVTNNTEDLTATGKVGTGCFDLNGANAIKINDHGDFTFIEGTNGDFSLCGWLRITDAGTEQVIISKWDETLGSQAREWKLLLDENKKLKMCLADESFFIDTDLVAHWKMNDNADTDVVVDSTGNYNGALIDGDDDYTSDHVVTGKVNSALDFDGADDRVAIGDDAAFTFGDAADDSPFSISAWINMDDATDFPIFCKYATGQTEYRFYLDAADKLVMRLHDDNSANYIGRTYNTALTAQEGNWIHVVATYDATEASSGITLYLNGSAVDNADSENNAYTAMHDNTADVFIGRMVLGADYADGKIDNVMLFNKELSQTEVTYLYNSGSGVENLGERYISSVTDDALETGWRFFAMTYNGEHGSWSGATAADYIAFYVEGAAVAATATNNANYGVMEDTAADIYIGAQLSTAGAIEKVWAAKIDEVAVFKDVLLAAEVASLYSTGAYEVATAYQEADLYGLQHAQSADVLYNVHGDYAPTKLERYAHDDWVLSTIVFDWPPFLTENKTTTTITPSATTGSITLTASKAIFTSDHIGSYWQIKHPRKEADGSNINPNSVSDSLASGGAPENGTTLTDVEGTVHLRTSKDYIGEFVLERTYDGTNWHTIEEFHPDPGTVHYNATYEEEDGDASYRVRTISGTDGTLEAVLSVERYYTYGIVQITAHSSPTSVTATVINTLGGTGATALWSEGAWSDERGYPASVAFYEGREWYAGTSYRPLTIWGTRTQDFENMKGGALDDHAVAFTVDSGAQNMIRWLVGQEVLLIGTSGGEWKLGSTDPSDAITPTNPMRPRIQTTYGSAEIQARLLANVVLFVDGAGRKVRGAQYVFEKGEAGGYDAPDYTLYAEHITESGIVGMAYQQNPYPILWCVLSDGTLIGMVFEPGQKVWGWFPLVIDGLVESVAVIPGTDEDEIWIIVNRTIDGETKRYIEYFKPRDWGSDQADCFFVDSGLTWDGGDAVTITGITKASPGVVTAAAHGFSDGDQVKITGVVGMTEINNKVFTVDSPATDTFSLRDKLDSVDWDTTGYTLYASGGSVEQVDNAFSGLTHLEGKTVSVLGDGSVHADVVVSSGAVTLTDYFNKVHIGLPFTSKLQPMKLEIPGGSVRGKTKRISRIVWSFFETLGAKYGTNEGEYTIPFRKTTDAMGSPPPLFTGEKTVSFPGDYELEGDIYVEQTQPLPLTVRSIIPVVGLSP